MGEYLRRISFALLFHFQRWDFVIFSGVFFCLIFSSVSLGFLSFLCFWVRNEQRKEGK